METQTETAQSEPARTRRHPTSDNTSRSTIDPNAPITIQETSLLTTALYAYLLGVEVIQRIERFTMDSLRFEIRATRSEFDMVNALLKDERATLSLKIMAERVQELQTLITKARTSGVYQRTAAARRTS